MLTDLAASWTRYSDEQPSSVLAVLRNRLGDDEIFEAYDDAELWAELPTEIRDACVSVAILERTTGKFPALETIARIAGEYGINPEHVVLVFGYLPPAWRTLSELDKSCIRCAAAMHRWGYQNGYRLTRQ